MMALVNFLALGPVLQFISIGNLTCRGHTCLQGNHKGPGWDLPTRPRLILDSGKRDINFVGGCSSTMHLHIALECMRVERPPVSVQCSEPLTCCAARPPACVAICCVMKGLHDPMACCNVMD